MNYKISLITTVKNEKDTIGIFLTSIVHQTKLPDEIIIVDGGSSDGTIDIIKNYKDKLPIKLIISPESNIAKGRNLAIRKAKYEIIVCTDGGCKLDINWVKNIIRPFKNFDIDVVSGVYVPWYENEFEEIVSYLTFPELDKIKPDTFLPSSRSIAFKREAWYKVGGYPEWLLTAEDTYFDIMLKQTGHKFAFERDAIVYWKVRRNIHEVYYQFYNYAKGDGFALLFPYRYIPRYIMALTFLLLSIKLCFSLFYWVSLILTFFAIFWIKYLKKVKTISCSRFYTALYISSVIEIGTFLGYVEGFIKRSSNYL